MKCESSLSLSLSLLLPGRSKSVRLWVGEAVRYDRVFQPDREG